MVGRYRRFLRNSYGKFGRTRTNLLIGYSIFVFFCLAIALSGQIFVLEPWLKLLAPQGGETLEAITWPRRLYVLAEVTLLAVAGGLLLFLGVARPIERHMERLRTKLQTDTASQEISVLSHWAEKRAVQLKSALAENKLLRQQLGEAQAKSGGRDAEVAALIGFSSEPLILIDTESTILDITASACETLAWRRDEAVSRDFDDVVPLFDHSKERPREYPLKGIPGNVMGAQSSLPHIEQALVLHRSGRELKGMIVVSTILDKTGSAVGAIVRVVVEGKASGVSRELASGGAMLADVGATGGSAQVMMSGLKTRDLFDRRLEELYDRTRTQQVTHGLLLLRFDRLAAVNDRHGFLALEELSWRLGREMKDHVAQAGDCYQLSWDRFAVVLGMCPPEKVREIAQSLRQHIATREFAWREERFTTTVSLALATINEQSAGRSQLVEETEASLLRVIQDGGNALRMVSDPMAGSPQRRDEAAWLAWVEPRLNTPMSHVISQEISSLRPSQKPMVECHLRVEDDDGAWVAPDAFRAALERQGRTAQIDLWMLRTLIEQLEQRDTLVQQYDSFHINLSAASLDDTVFAAKVAQILRDTRVPAAKICFDIHEVDVSHHGLRLRDFAETLRDAGARLWLDQCKVGLGVAALRELPIHGFKLDEALIAQALTQPLARAQLEWLCTTARVMKLATVACGVDDAAALATLRPLGFDYIQGNAVNRMGPLVI